MKIVTTRTLYMNTFVKYQKFSPPIHRDIKHSKAHRQKIIYRDSRTIARSQQQRRSRLFNIGLCNMHLPPDGYLKMYTFKPKDAQFDLKKFNRSITDFIRRFEYYLGYKPIYIGVAEQHDSYATSEARRYSYHMHMLFFNIPYLKSTEIEQIYGLGFVTATARPVILGHKALSYVLKYLTKASTLNARVLMSRGILRPKVDYNLPAPDLPMLYENSTLILEAGTTITTRLYKNTL